MAGEPMSFDDSPESHRTVLQVFGKYLAFLAGTVFVGMLSYLCIGWWVIPLTDRSRGEILSYYAALTGASFCLLLAGLSIRFQRNLIGFGLMLLAWFVFACMMPDR
jgi:hypothetical protein